MQKKLKIFLFIGVKCDFQRIRLYVGSYGLCTISWIFESYILTLANFKKKPWKHVRDCFYYLLYCQIFVCESHVFIYRHSSFGSFYIQSICIPTWKLCIIYSCVCVKARLFYYNFLHINSIYCF